MRAVRLLLRGDPLELRGELLDPARRVDQALLPGVGRMGVHGDVAQDDEIFHSVDGFLAGRLHRRAGEETLARRHIEEANVVERGMAFRFHGGKKRLGSALPRFVTRVGLVDHVDFATTADHLAVRVTLLRGFDGGNNFHKRD